mmetsp:Transcript_4571/g.7440  ORF Transcript_4571/g.7440 Transcript_4571/m.7440 type:complete len:272 (+) Transcript_4571:773-1588(+)
MSVGTLVRGRLRNKDLAEGHTQLRGCDLAHFGVETLAHFGTAVRHKNSAVRVNVHKCARLVHELCRERHAELDRHHGQATLLPSVSAVKGIHCYAPRREIRRLLNLCPHFTQVAIYEFLPVMRHCTTASVEILLSDLLSGLAQSTSNVLNIHLSRNNALGATKATEGSIRGQVCSTDAACDTQVGDAIGVVNMKHCTVKNWTRQIHRKAAVGKQAQVGSQQQTVVIIRDLILQQEWVALASSAHVGVTIQHEPHRLASLLRSHGKRHGNEH